MLQSEKEQVAKENVLSKINDLPVFSQSFFTNNNSATFTSKNNSYGVFKNFLLFIKDLYGLNDIKEIPPFILENLSLDEINQYKDNLLKNNSESTTNTKINNIKGIFKYLYKNKIINTNIMSQVIVDNHKSERKKIKMDDIYSLIYSISDIPNEFLRIRNLVIVSLIIDTGLSVQDIVELNICHVKNYTIVYEMEGNIIQYLLNTETIQYLKQYMTMIRNEDNNMPLFISTQNSRISDSAIKNIFKTYSDNLKPSDFQSKPNIKIGNTHNYILLIKPKVFKCNKSGW